MNRLTILGAFMAAALFSSGARADGPGDASVIESMDGLVGFWTFGEAPGNPRVSQGTPTAHALAEVGGAVNRVTGGPFSGYAADFQGGYLSLPYAQTGDLNIHGDTAEVTVIAFVKLRSLGSSTVAGMWSEGQGANDDTGTRQYSLLLDIHAYGGGNKVTPHISSEGGVTYRADGSKFPWCVDYAAGSTDIETGEWVSVAFTYDSEYIRAYYNGVMDARDPNPVADNREDPYFTTGGPDGGNRGMNPYYHGRGIFSYDPNTTYDPPKIDPPPFTVGARQAVGKDVAETLDGIIGGLVVFNRALSDAEVLAVHESAALDQLNNSGNDPDPEDPEVNDLPGATPLKVGSMLQLDCGNTPYIGTASPGHEDGSATGTTWNHVTGDQAGGFVDENSDPVSDLILNFGTGNSASVNYDGTVKAISSVASVPLWNNDLGGDQIVRDAGGNVGLALELSGLPEGDYQFYLTAYRGDFASNSGRDYNVRHTVSSSPVTDFSGVPVEVLENSNYDTVTTWEPGDNYIVDHFTIDAANPNFYLHIEAPDYVGVLNSLQIVNITASTPPAPTLGVSLGASQSGTLSARTMAIAIDVPPLLTGFQLEFSESLNSPSWQNLGGYVAASDYLPEGLYQVNLTSSADQVCWEEASAPANAPEPQEACYTVADPPERIFIRVLYEY